MNEVLQSMLRVVGGLDSDAVRFNIDTTHQVDEQNQLRIAIKRTSVKVYSAYISIGHFVGRYRANNLNDLLDRVRVGIERGMIPSIQRSHDHAVQRLADNQYPRDWRRDADQAEVDRAPARIAALGHVVALL